MLIKYATTSNNYECVTGIPLFVKMKIGTTALRKELKDIIYEWHYNGWDGERGVVHLSREGGKRGREMSQESNVCPVVINTSENPMNDKI